MSEMVERVARAIYLAQAKIDDHSGGDNDLALQADMHWESCIPHARAAIEAMREHFTQLSGPDFSSSEFDGAIAAIDEALRADTSPATA